ncbi:hypothetical protein B7463_g873, partial [Scytalidium lignicola]
MGSISESEFPSIQIPIIDISGYINGNVENGKQIAAEIHAACQFPGFFQITGHGVSAEQRSNMMSKIAEFFALPASIKQSIARLNSKCLRGYEMIGEQSLQAGFQDQKEGFNIGVEFPDYARYHQGPNQWPPEEAIPGFRETFSNYFDTMRRLSKIMFRLMALSLDLDENYFDDFVGSRDANSPCRMLHYPPTTPEQALKSRGIGAHTDFGALTLLLQDDVGGLEVFHRATETWHPVKPIEGAFVVNIGDMMGEQTPQTPNWLSAHPPD